MDVVASAFVQGPWAIATVAAAHLVVWRYSRGRTLSGAPSRAWLVAGIAWAVYAVWETGVMIASPEANIRVDLLLIWPALLVLTGRAVWKTFRAARPPSPDPSVQLSPPGGES